MLVWAVATTAVRGPLNSHLGGTALLYIGVPFAVTAALLLADEIRHRLEPRSRDVATTECPPDHQARIFLTLNSY
jgi:hypothetical protein